MFSINEVGDCGFQTYPHEMKLERSTAFKFTTITPIFYKHCYALFLFFLTKNS